MSSEMSEVIDVNPCNIGAVVSACHIPYNLAHKNDVNDAASDFPEGNLAHTNSADYLWQKSSFRFHT